MGDNLSGRKAYAQAIIEKHPRIQDNLEITFKKEEMKYLDLNHDDALVISVSIINLK